MSVNQAAPNRSQGRSKKHADASSVGEAESCAIDHAFVKAVLAAAHTAQVNNIRFALLSLSFSMRCNADPWGVMPGLIMDPQCLVAGVTLVYAYDCCQTL